ncbi:MAG: hypothetical protein E7575_06040 [Ruminococcaceae bacterium]|nr:hypothetical protein [Oscillospiraceae bacterium]
MRRDEFDTHLNGLLLSAERLIPEKNLPDLPYMESAPTVHDWYDFELELWKTGEDIRQLILSDRKELNAEQADRVCKICVDIRAKRGRQSFIMLLGKKRYVSYADRIAAVLTDEDIDGHIISTLYKMGASQYIEKIKPYTDHAVAWIRNEAKRYIKKYGV